MGIAVMDPPKVDPMGDRGEALRGVSRRFESQGNWVVFGVIEAEEMKSVESLKALVGNPTCGGCS